MMINFFAWCMAITGTYVISASISLSKSWQELRDLANPPTREELMRRSFKSGLICGLTVANLISAVGLIYVLTHA